VAPRNRGLKFKLLRRLARWTRCFHPRGTDRLLRLIYSPDRRQNDHIDVVVDYDRDLLIHVDTASFIEWSIFFFGHYEPEAAALVRRLLGPGAVAVDVGANVGCHTLIMSRAVGVQGRVLAVEPNPAVCERLAANVALNRLTNVDILPVGLSDTAGQATLFAPPKGFPNQGTASLSPRSTSSTEVPIDVETVDSVVHAQGLDRLDLVKVDVEGLDLKVLLGAQKSIETHRPHLLFEYDAGEWEKAGSSFGQCNEFLTELGYALYVVYAVDCLLPVDDAPPRSANLLAVPERVAPCRK